MPLCITLRYSLCFSSGWGGKKRPQLVCVLQYLIVRSGRRIGVILVCILRAGK